VGVWRGEIKSQAMYVETLSEGSRTRVRFPPPPPFLKREALVIQGLFYFGRSKSSVAGPSLGVIHLITFSILDFFVYQTAD